VIWWLVILRYRQTLGGRQAARTTLPNASSDHRETLKQELFARAGWFGAEAVGDQRHGSKYAQALNLPPSFCNLAVSTHDEWLKDEVRQFNDPFKAIHECFDSGDGNISSIALRHAGMEQDHLTKYGHRSHQ